MHWFKHDTDARNSIKIRKLRRKYGADGYAIYWFCLEAIAQGVNKDNLTFQLKEDSEMIAYELDIQEKRVEEIMIFLIQLKLFEQSNSIITCLKLAERIDQSMTNSPAMRKWIKESHDTVSTCHDTVSTCLELEEKRIEEKRIDTKTKEKSFSDLCLDLGVDKEILSDWLKVRKTKKATNTVTSFNAIKKQIELSHLSANDCIKLAVEKSWSGFNSSWVENNNAPTQYSDRQQRMLEIDERNRK